MAEIDFSDLIPAPKAPIDFSDLIPPAAMPAPSRDLGTGMAAVRGALNGIPIAGPVILDGLQRAAAGLRTVKNGTAYADELALVRDLDKTTADAHPYVTTGTEIAGGVAGTVPMVMAAPAAFGISTAALPVRAATSMATSGVLGGADAAVRSGGDGDAALAGAGIGAITGAAAPYLGAAVGKAAGAVASKIKPAAAAPSVSELKDAARAAYSRADDAGVQVAQPSFAAFVDDASRAAQEAGIDRTIHPKATAAVGRLEEAAGTAPTLKDIELLRRVVKGAGGALDPDEKRIASLLVDKLDEFTGGLKQSDLIRGDADTAVAALDEARGLWSRAKKAETIETAMTKAEDRAASTGSGGNSDNAIRQNIRAILDSPKKRAGFTPNEINAMRMIVRGTPVQNALRLIGKLSPAGNGLMAMLGINAAAINPTLAIPQTAGYFAKKAADRGTTQNVERLLELIRSGGQPAVPPLALPARRAAERITGFGLAGLPVVANQWRP